MNLRIGLSRLLLNLSRLLECLPVFIMRPDDLQAFGRRTYGRPDVIANWSQPELLARGLTELEQALLEQLPVRTGRLCILGVGGGREVVPLATSGFHVSGLDYIPEMLENAKKAARQHGLDLETVQQDFSAPELPAEHYDVFWLSAAMYSSVPTRRRRVAMLQRLRHALRPGGCVCCQFQWGAPPTPRRSLESARRLVTWLTWGNFQYEAGDRLWAHGEFIHTFSSEEVLRSEFREAGFCTSFFYRPSRWREGGAILVKEPANRCHCTS